MKPEMSWLVGASLASAVREQERAWRFSFSDGSSLQVECQWNIVSGGRVVLASGDHNQQYGLTSPIDTKARASEHLMGRIVEAIYVDPASADLAICLSGSVELRTFNDSSGYEAWLLTNPQGDQYIAQGGGTIVTFGVRTKA